MERGYRFYFKLPNKLIRENNISRIEQEFKTHFEEEQLMAQHLYFPRSCNVNFYEQDGDNVVKDLTTVVIECFPLSLN